MSRFIDIIKINVLPPDPELLPDKIYFVLDGDNAETWITDANSIKKRVGNTQMISSVNAGNSDKNYIFDQSVPSNTWSITHSLDKFPSVTILNSAGDEVEGQVNHIDNNNVIITFSASFSGRAYLN